MRVSSYLSFSSPVTISWKKMKKWKENHYTGLQLSSSTDNVHSLFISPLLLIFLKKICWRGGRIKRRGSHYLFKNNPKELHNLLRGIWVHNDRETQIFERGSSNSCKAEIMPLWPCYDCYKLLHITVIKWT